MKTWKKILLAGGAVLVLLVGGLAAAPLLFQDEIEARVKAAINESVDARVEFGDVGLSLFRSFPNLSFSLRDLAVTGVAAFEGDTLAHVGELRTVVDLGSAVRMLRGGDALVVRSVVVTRPYVHARVLEDGRASWNIARAANEAAEVAVAPDDQAAGRPVRVALRRFAIEDARLALDDARTDLHARVDGFGLEVAGDLSQERVTLDTRAQASGVTVRQLGVALLDAARLDARAAVDADLVNRRFAFRENRVGLNALGLAFDGTAALVEEGWHVDLTFGAERASFRDVLSLVPAKFLEGYETLETGGTVALAGHVRGLAGPGEGAVPAFEARLEVDDGMFRYPELPLPARGIFVDLVVRSPGGDLDSTRVELSRFAVLLGDEPFEATMTLATPVSDPALDLTMNGRVDLAHLAGAVPLEGIDTLRGVITTDAAVRTRLSSVEDVSRADAMEASGTVEVRGLAVRGSKLSQPVDVDELRLALSPRHAELASLRARAGSSDFTARGRLDNLVGFALRGEVLRGQATVSSDLVVLDEWMVRPRPERELRVIPVPPNVDLSLAATVNRMTFDDLEMTDARGAVRVADRRLTLSDFAVRTLGGEIVTTGWYETTDVARPTFDFDFAMAGLDIAGAFGTFNTVRALAPAAEYATGRFSADLGMAGAMGEDMMPVYDVLDGAGTIRTQGVSLRGMPALHRLADAVRVDQLRDPALSDFMTRVKIEDGRLHVDPFDVRLGGVRLSAGGSNGIDRSLDYRLTLEVPRAELGAEANRVVSGLLAESGRIGVDLGAAEMVRLAAVVGGTMTDPAIRVAFDDVVGSAGGAVRDAAEARLRQEAEEARLEAERRVAEARAAAEREAAEREAAGRAAARERADSILADAEAQAARIRAEAKRAADRVRQETNEAADKLVAEATNPLARRAAEAAATRMRREGEERAAQIEREADERAEAVLVEARERAEALTAG